MTGDHRKARDSYEQAITVLQEKQTSSPDRAELKFMMAQAYQRLGSVPSGPVERGGAGPGERKTEGPAASTLTALGLLGDLVDAEPENARYRHARALAYRNLAALHIRDGRQKEADAAADRAIDILGRLARKFPAVPDYRYDLVLACTLEPAEPRDRPDGRGEPSGAWKDRYRTALETAKRLAAAHPGVPAYQAAVGRACMSNAGALQRERRNEEAEHCLREAISVLEPLAGQEALALAYVCDYLRAAQSLARLLKMRGELSKGKALLEESIAIAENALKAGPQRRHEWRVLAKQFEELAAICSKLGEAPRAEEASQRARQILEEKGPDPRPRERGRRPPPRD